MRNGVPLVWHHNGHDGVSNHQPHDCLLNCLFRRRSKKTSKLPVTGLCAGNSPVTSEFPAQMASNPENVSNWRHHHTTCLATNHYQIYHQVSNIRRTLVSNWIVDHSDVVGASPVGTAPTTSSFSTQHLASTDWVNTTTRWDEKHWSFEIWCILY